MKSNWDEISIKNFNQQFDDHVNNCLKQYDSSSTNYSDNNIKSLDSKQCDNVKCHNHLLLTLIPVVNATGPGCSTSVFSSVKTPKFSVPGTFSECTTTTATNICTNVGAVGGSGSQYINHHHNSNIGNGGATTSTTSPFFTAHANLLSTGTSAFNTLFWSTRLNLPSITIKLINTNPNTGSNLAPNGGSTVDNKNVLAENKDNVKGEQQRRLNQQKGEQQTANKNLSQFHTKFLDDSVTLNPVVPPASQHQIPNYQDHSQYNLHYQDTTTVEQINQIPPTGAIAPTGYFNWSLLQNIQHQLTLAEKQRYERLFSEIDVDGKGVIDFNDLLYALERKGIKASHDNVKVCVDIRMSSYHINYTFTQ